METKFVDVHAHLSDKAFEVDLDGLMHKLQDYIILNSGENPQENDRISTSSEKYPNLLPCIGLHPNYISFGSREDVSTGIDYLEKNVEKAFAVSEIGLDFRNKDEEQIERQKAALSKALEIAEKNGKVCILHSRKAVRGVIGLKESFKIPFIIHNFEGNLSDLHDAESRGIYISVSTGFLKFKRDNVVRDVDLDFLFTESDSPALSPNDRINTPLNVPLLLDYMSGIKKLPANELKERIYSNFVKLFHG